ncbi:PREDICTED: uncharacterized protein LOC109583673 [Amphimedon queenslandica]|uniref:Caspase family p20 domain-containing protein n=1 Tax=Amphimedon queenslandica TaxID=400682 RepID=A0AAN0JD49_AMPQE|nr:PREDICTED: uncharacterized protein LOC109583673 [Amphimedon queenslandica]|eukprot:XP_019854667.1 PREDICTED: uncharacterized protein LOC109583673 [Amphimedon queenslandica]
MELPKRNKDEYDISGLCTCVIFNNLNFKTMPRRSGSDKDATDIRIVFQKLGFIVHTYRDCTSDEMRHHLKESKRKNIGSVNACFFIFFLSHGYTNGIYGVDGTCFAFTELQTCLIPALPTLSPLMDGIPKVFIFQSCRNGEEPNKKFETPDPLDDHILLVFATQPNCQAYRNHTEGSHMVQCLLQAMKEYPHETNIINILTHTNRLLAQKTQYQRLRFNSSLMHSLHLPRARVNNLGRVFTASYEKEVTNSECAKSANTHEEQHKIAIIPRPPAFVINCGLCLVFNNSSHHSKEAQIMLQNIMEIQGYAFLSFDNINWKNMKLLIKETSKIACQAFALFVLSEGEEEFIYDSNKKIIPIRRILDYFSPADNPLSSFPKFFYFQTTIITKETEREGARGLPGQRDTRRSSRENFGVPPLNSVCCQVSTESSLLFHFFKNIQRFEDEIGELIPLREILEYSLNEGKKSALVFEEGQKPPPLEVIWSHVCSNPVNSDMDLTLKCNKVQIQVASLKLIAEIKMNINKRVQRIYDKTETIKAEKEAIFCHYFDEYLQVTVSKSQVMQGSESNEDTKLKSQTKQIITTCQLEEKLCSRNTNIIEAIKRSAMSQTLEKELHNYQSCARWTLTAFYQNMSPTQDIDPKQLMQVHCDYIQLSLEAVEGIEGAIEQQNNQVEELELSQISSLHNDQPLEQS